MNITAKKFTDYLTAKQLNYRIVNEDDEDTAVKLGIRGKNCNIEILVIFPNNGRYAWIRCFGLANVPEDKLGNAMLACNHLNRNYKWVKFYVDEEDSVVNVEDDAVINEETCAEECYELFCRMVDIADQSYPVIMKAIYA